MSEGEVLGLVPDKRGLVFRAIPEFDGVGATVLPGGGIDVVMPNQHVPPKQIETVIKANYATVFYGDNLEKQIEGAPWILNLCADADAFEGALKDLSRILEKTGKAVFNHPDGILASRRDRSAGALTGIDGLIVPKCLRFEPSHFRDFRAAFDAHGFEYPVIVRPAGSQTGRGMVRVMSADDWDIVHSIPWQGMAVYMTQFVDCRNEQGEFTKLRILCNGGRVTARHIFFDNQWNVHAIRRTPENVDRELPILTDAHHWPVIKNIAQAAMDSLKLDCFGMDLGMIDRDTFVLFEANAAMTNMGRGFMIDYRRDEYEVIIDGIIGAMVAAYEKKGIAIPL